MYLGLILRLRSPPRLDSAFPQDHEEEWGRGKAGSGGRGEGKGAWGGWWGGGGGGGRQGGPEWREKGKLLELAGMDWNEDGKGQVNEGWSFVDALSNCRYTLAIFLRNQLHVPMRLHANLMLSSWLDSIGDKRLTRGPQTTFLLLQQRVKLSAQEL